MYNTMAYEQFLFDTLKREKGEFEIGNSRFEIRNSYLIIFHS